MNLLALKLAFFIGAITFSGGIAAVALFAPKLWTEAHLSHVDGQIDFFDEKSKRARQLHKVGQVLMCIGSITAAAAIYVLYSKF